MRVAVLPFFLRVHWWYGPWSGGGSAWQRQFGWPQRVSRSARVPGRAKPAAVRAAISAAMAAARACWSGVGGTFSLSQADRRSVRFMQYNYCMKNAEAAAYIGRWEPSTVSGQAASFAVDAAGGEGADLGGDGGGAGLLVRGGRHVLIVAEI